VAVIGLGRFGGAVAAEMERLGFEVLGIDGDGGRVQYYADMLTHVVQADATDETVLRQLGVPDFRHAVVGIGNDVEASILTTAALADLGVADIWAKAITRSHGRILERVGAHHVVFPEHDMGHRVAHLVGGRKIDWFLLDEDFAMVEAIVPNSLAGQTLGDLGIRARFGVTVVCVKPEGSGAWPTASGSRSARRRSRRRRESRRPAATSCWAWPAWPWWPSSSWTGPGC